MSVPVKHYEWHRVWHNRRMADAGYQLADLEARGVLDTLSNLAGQTNNNGSIRVGSTTALTKEQAIDYLARTVPGADRRRIRKAVEFLLEANLLTSTRSGPILVANWSEDQKCAWSPSAVRQQRHRANKNGPEEDGDDHPGAASPASPPPQVPGSGSECDMSRIGSVTCHTYLNGEIEKEKDHKPESEGISIPLSSEPEQAAQSGSGQNGGGEAGERSFDLWQAEPVHAACRLTRDFTRHNHNSFQKRLEFLQQKFGPEKGLYNYRDCLQQFAAWKREGGKPRAGNELSSVLNGIFNRAYGRMPK